MSSIDPGAGGTLVWSAILRGSAITMRTHTVRTVLPGIFALVLHAHARGGTFDKHGLGKGTVQGFIAGTHAVAPDRV
jgi:hypothetical protein